MPNWCENGLPGKFSYPPKPVTVTAEVSPNSLRGGFPRQLRKKIVSRATELAGVIPFDWDLVNDYFVVFFGFDTMGVGSGSAS
jgi:hypothetical protein